MFVNWLITSFWNRLLMKLCLIKCIKIWFREESRKRAKKSESFFEEPDEGKSNLIHFWIAVLEFKQSQIIDRKNVFNSAFQQLSSLSPFQLIQTNFNIRYLDEVGVDQGNFDLFFINNYFWKVD